ncbi:hypothetical protein HELRODRAFT_191912 [Helobdella robusta]|uniref:Lipase maturation factor n=1 Tax=Helobdella robusta TaxID=6412 RepID=T1FTE8_HELRO|nr:hypothetical protein HELRODRAFT_191912 [Helobdella robusta]ESO03664.1 hypothetical protein HELRODRAFT_191912 [Helobdella robusta]
MISKLFLFVLGLFGENGISPAELVISKGLDIDLGLDFLCVGGLTVSFVSIISKDHRNALVALLQWIFYLSIAQVGHVFLSYKWDSLLLEISFVAIFLAPFGLFGLHDDVKTSPRLQQRRSANQNRDGHHGSKRLLFWLVRWILFRLILAEALTGLDDIFGTGDGKFSFPEATQIATNADNLASVFPSVIFSSHSDRASLAEWLGDERFGHFAIEASAWCGLQMGGKTSQTDTAPLCEHHSKPEVKQSRDAHPSKVTTSSAEVVKDSKKEKKSNGISSTFRAILKVSAGFAVVAAILALYGLPAITQNGEDDNDELAGKAEKEDEENAHVSVVRVAKKYFCPMAGEVAWEGEITLNMWFGGLSIRYFSSKFQVPLTWYDGQTSGQYLPSELQETYLWSHKHYRLVNNYVTASKRVEINGSPIGRLEVIFEGSHSLKGSDWLEYSFKFKPGNVNVVPPFVAPHHPRLDETLHLASRDSYKEHHWILNLVYRLLTNQEEVLELLKESPFQDGPPRYMRASLYRYKFNNNDHNNDDEDGGDGGKENEDDDGGDGGGNVVGGDDKDDEERLSAIRSPKTAATTWWDRKWIGYYLPVLSIDDPKFSEYLKLSGIIRIEDRVGQRSKESNCKHSNVLGSFLSFVRSLLGQSDGGCLCLVLISLALLLAHVDLSSSSSFSSSSPSFSSSSSSLSSTPLATKRGKSPRPNQQCSNNGGVKTVDHDQHDQTDVINVPIHYVDKTRM